ncbi:MAG: hypothetical protein P1U53_09125 [Sulfitobacter sp.]|nr:hypothetical protein [Sulfitobacter sp.]
MAYQDIPQPARVLIREIATTRQTLALVGMKIGAALAVVGRALVLNSAAQARLDRVQALQSKSDAELAEFGIRREDIVHYVFRDVLHL